MLRVGDTATKEKKVLRREMELVLMWSSGNVVAGARTRTEKYSEKTCLRTNIKGKGGTLPLYDSLPPRW